MCNTTPPAPDVAAIGTKMLENNRIRVTEWRFKKKGDSTGWHKHEYDYVVVPLFTGILEIETPDKGRISWPVENGIPYTREANTEHDVINGNDFECAFIEVELLEPPQKK
ncbi:cupin [Cohaesibacter gelatinilyticus]|uniref:Cupin domain-containing protein n=1 Tax=Cohaesibacter gelatinilyticus TaxID=372072 RepID=A0A285NHW6_9HYPH|nr:cupin [Cohaesibacter gelatinilyticus]SNZ09112.1 hypothetical protein SAMN06265368_1939 [Cohaesibacter gelatinilyticus]HAT85636.1 cupin [Hyphomicrobiales bacterium]